MYLQLTITSTESANWILVHGADEVYLELNHSKLKIKLKITLGNRHAILAGDSVGPLTAILIALFLSM